MQLLPKIIKQHSDRLLGDDIIGVRPGETQQQSYNRFLLEQRNKKINNILKRNGYKINHKKKGYNK